MTQAMKIAIVDDEQDMRQSISQWLALSGYDTETFASAEDALKVLGPEYPGIVISDIKMPGMDGMMFLWLLRPCALVRLISLKSRSTLTA
jgi:DNA-binding NtrC family response regulator